MKRTIIVAALIVTAWMFNSIAQDNPLQGAAGEKGLGAGKGKGGHERPSQEQMAKRVMEKFDANKDGELTQDELIQALTALREHRKQRAGKEQSSDKASGEAGKHQAKLTPDKIAAKMIEKFSSDKKGLTEAELAKAIAAHRAKREQHRNGSGHGEENKGGAQSAGQGQGAI